jgi:hypothetical protein
LTLTTAQSPPSVHLPPGKRSPHRSGSGFVERVGKNDTLAGRQTVETAAYRLLSHEYKYRRPARRHSFGYLLHELFIAAEIGQSARGRRRGENKRIVTKAKFKKLCGSKGTLALTVEQERR